MKERIMDHIHPKKSKESRPSKLLCKSSMALQNVPRESSTVPNESPKMLKTKSGFSFFTLQYSDSDSSLSLQQVPRESSELQEVPKLEKKGFPRDLRMKEKKDTLRESKLAPGRRQRDMIFGKIISLRAYKINLYTVIINGNGEILI
eukprot:TRINITY_DN597_c0_g3_i2.p1 TRINITY_DN597_c0_g3~~TRINITY_DN597_c0_g3_i2.p1  ORF type:complete len:147 (+),score=19.55 TRINITY_DN597_c0_g3_i2:569-1009(+)